MGAKVLVVDDEQDFNELIRHNLNPALYDVITATNGVEALNKARRFLPDVILLDLMLPDIDGLSLCEILRRQPSTADIPIVMITAMAGEIQRYNALSAGAKCFLTKPVDMRHLRESIADAVASRQRPVIDAPGAGPHDLLDG